MSSSHFQGMPLDSGCLQRIMVGAGGGGHRCTPVLVVIYPCGCQLITITLSSLTITDMYLTPRLQSPSSPAHWVHTGNPKSATTSFLFPRPLPRKQGRAQGPFLSGTCCTSTLITPPLSPLFPSHPLSLPRTVASLPI